MKKKEKIIKKAKADIEKLLEQRPELKPLQEEIERRLKMCTSSQDRLQMLMMMITGENLKLSKACTDILNICEKIGVKDQSWSKDVETDNPH